METNTEKILDKVRKLLAKADVKSGATESEMESALKMAQKLMIKHNIEEGHLIMSPSDIGSERVENAYKHGEAKLWIWDLLCVIGEGYSCKVTRRGYTDHYFYNINGFTEDRKMVNELFEMTLPVIRNLYKTRFKEYQKNGGITKSGIFTRNYIVGFLHGLREKLESDKEVILSLPEEKEVYGLMVINKYALINEVLGELKSASSSPRNREANAYIQLLGLEDGKERNLSKQIG